jgi:phosphotriesterase-related protein
VVAVSERSTPKGVTMSRINTVLGSISPADLGTTLVHEHCVIGFPGWEWDPLPGPPNRKKMVRACLRVLEPAKACGLQSLVEVTPSDLSRDVDIMKEVSEKSQINIICSTGKYTDENGVWAYLKWRDKLKLGDIETDLYDLFMQEITIGIGRSGAKAGAIKVATSLNTIASSEEAVLRAAARACKETGVPVITHTEDGTMGPEQADILIAGGLDPKRIMIGHMCGNPSLHYQKDVLSKGVNIAFDRFGIEIFLSDAVRIKTLVALLGEGFAENIMLSQDYVGASFGRGGIWPEYMLPHVTNWSYAHIFHTIIPALKQVGISDQQIGTMMVDNPRRLLAGEL